MNEESYNPAKERNQKVYDEVSKTVFGHDKAKKILINLVNRSKARYIQNTFLKAEKHQLVSTINCLLVGESGTGKTHLVQTLADVMQFPFMILSATELTHTSAGGGVKVADIEQQIVDTATKYHRQYPNTYISIASAVDQMIVFVDEVDKLADKSSSDWNRTTQATFLKLFENGCKFEHISFIFAGAFSRDSLVEKKKNLGFSKEEVSTEEIDYAEAIIRYGLISELVGRMGNIALLDKLSVGNYYDILTNHVLPKEAYDLLCMGSGNLHMADWKKREIAEKAHKSGMGVRSLTMQVRALLVDAEFNGGENYVSQETEF